jgi:hypothetical protein
MALGNRGSGGAPAVHHADEASNGPTASKLDGIQQKFRLPRRPSLAAGWGGEQMAAGSSMEIDVTHRSSTSTTRVTVLGNIYTLAKLPGLLNGGQVSDYVRISRLCYQVHRSLGQTKGTGVQMHSDEVCRTCNRWHPWIGLR